VKIKDRGAVVDVAHTEPSATVSTGARSGGRQRSMRNVASRVPESAALIVVLAALVLFFTLESPYFFNSSNFINILIASAVVGLVACPGTMLLISGQFDLSVGGLTALVTCGFAESYVHHNPLIVSILLALGIGLGVGAVNGFLVTVVGINPLITTIGTMEITRAFAYILTGGVALGFNGFTTLGITRPLLNIPWMVWIFLMVVVITMFTMRRTTYGRRLFAIGANPAAARLAGIRSKRVIFVTFCLSGLACGLTGLLLASQTGQGSGDAAMGLEFSVITAVVLGGASLGGGRGSMFGTLLAVLVIGVVNDGIVLLSINSFWQEVVTGFLLIIAVAIDQLRLRLAAT
jgi:ribose transport system permease protein